MSDVASPNGLPFQTPGEWAAHLRWHDLVVTDAGIGGIAQEIIGRPIDRAETLLFRTEGITLADRAVIAGIRRLGEISRRTLPAALVISTYRRLGQQIDGLEDVRKLPLEDIDRAVMPVAATYLKGAGVGGAIAGALGAGGVIGGIPPLLFVSLHAIHRLALLHGHDIRKPAEQRFAVLVLATSLVTRPKLRDEVVGRLQTVAQELESGALEQAEGASADDITKNVAEALALQIVLGFVTRGWPLMGSIVGAGYTRAFLARAFLTARAAYGQRALLRRYGDAAKVT
jgi:hypothetical protein